MKAPLHHKRPSHKYKILLDECCAVKKYYPRLNSYHHVEHIVEDCKKIKLTDPQVYKLACSKGYLLVTVNKKDFENLVKYDASGIIGLSGNMTPDQIDAKLMTFLKKNSPKKLKGKYHVISNETVD